jgi:drug/metabolite transporter (DMT)-like permease
VSAPALPIDLRVPPERGRAVAMLTAGTIGWALSFPFGKAAMLAMEAAAPGRASWLFAGLTLIVRFGGAALLLALWRPRELRRITRLEWKQGLGLGLFGGVGILLQADGLHYTDASTSAFLTQFYCILLPLAAAVRTRRAPRPVVLVSCAAVLVGVALLAQVDLRTFHIGRGELETILASVLFTAQILWLERPLFRANDTARMSFVMFTSTALIVALMALPHAHGVADLLLPVATLPIAVFVAVLCLASTLFSYMVMNHWQPRVDATHAGLIYCAEPVFTSAFATFLPAMLSAAAGIVYFNEQPGRNLLVGGGLITAANVLMLLRPERERKT